MTPLGFTTLCLVAGVGSLLVWRLTWSGVRANYIRSSYVDDRRPITLRTSFAVIPIVGIGILAAGPLPHLPRLMAAWLSIPVLAVILIAFVLTYRTPLRLLPPWLREEIEAGITPVARPDWGDWLLFAIVVPIMSLGVLGLPVLLVVYGAAGP